MLTEARRWLVLVLVWGAMPAEATPPAVHPSKVFFGITSRYEPSPQGGRELVEKVVPGGPAARAGLKDGDWILGFNGQPHRAASLSALLDSMGWIEAGQPIQVDVLRQGKTIAVSIVPEKASPGQQRALLSWLEECRREPGGCNELCSGEESAAQVSLRQLAMQHGQVALIFVQSSTGEPTLLRTEPAMPGWEFRRDPVLSDGAILDSIRKLLASRPEVTAVYQMKEAGRFSLALKI